MSRGHGGGVGEKVWEGVRCKRGRRGGVRGGGARCRRGHAFASLEFPKLANAQPSNFGPLPYFNRKKIYNYLHRIHIHYLLYSGLKN